MGSLDDSGYILTMTPTGRMSKERVKRTFGKSLRPAGISNIYDFPRMNVGSFSCIFYFELPYPSSLFLFDLQTPFTYVLPIIYRINRNFSGNLILTLLSRLFSLLKLVSLRIHLALK